MRKITLLMAALAVSFATMAVGLSGTYKVGTGQIAPNYASLSAAVSDLNTNGVAGDVILEITSDITEASNIGLGVNTNGFGITIRPDADTDRTITFTKTADNTAASGHFVIGLSVLTSAWADANIISTNNVTIDGYAVGGTTRKLKITTASASMSGSKLTVIVGACENTVIKNCIYENNSTGGSAQCIGMVTRKGTSVEVGPIGVKIDNNIITSIASLSGQGINTTSSGTLTTVRTTGLVVKNNIITAQGRCGWFYYINGGDFYNNEFHLTQLGNANTVNYGLWTSTGAGGTFNIYNNKFIESTTMEGSASGTLGMRTMSLAAGTYNIYNNMFAGIDRKTAATAIVNQTYIFFGGTDGMISNNTFYMPALTANTTPGYYQAITLSFANPDIKNNIFISNEDAVVNAFYGSVSTGAIDYNVYYNKVGTTKSLIVAGTTNSTLALHQAANPTKDINSKSVNVNFVNVVTGDLTIAGASIQDNNLSVPRLTTVLTDMNGVVRSDPTYAGALESTLPFIITFIDNNVEKTARIARTSTGIEITLDGESTIELYTINGMMIDKTRTNGSYSRDLNNGIYIIRINGKATKFVK
ncbi:MAG: T9SS type A sorting domain-containing protein [Paludibacter sp.]|nr:T9SS type A sorting domain-containing protein [Paludibacter sp.]